jgi:hypothetical protein
MPAILRRTAPVDILGDADVVEDLHRSHVEQVRARKARRQVAPFKQQDINPRLRQKQRGGQPARPAADDQDRSALLNLRGAGRHVRRFFHTHAAPKDARNESRQRLDRTAEDQEHGRGTSPKRSRVPRPL